MSSRLQHILLWFIALAIILTGGYLTHINFMQTDWLSRAGCVVVMLGIWSGLGVVLQEKVLMTRLKWQRRNAITSARARLAEQEQDEDTIKLKIEEINNIFDKRYEEMRHAMKLSLGVLEVSLLLTGTFLWGFGDLFMK
ncbi:MAG: hypothetical protein RIB78_02730 [Gammaproteobacteria bacterium]